MQMIQPSMCVVRNWSRLSQALKMLLKGFSKWFFDSSMKLNPNKCHLLIFRGNNTDLSVHIGETVGIESVEEKLLGVPLDKNLDSMSQFSY